MKKYLQIGLAASFLIGLLTLVACKDDEPPTPSELSFAVSSMTVNEADGVIEIEIVLDKPALEDFTVEYEIGGSAQDEETETDETPSADFVVLDDENDYGEVDFEKGQSTGIILIELYSDYAFEDDEIIEISLTDVDSDLVELTRDDEIEITLMQEDGLVVVLNWCSAAACPSVDMDLIIRIGENTSTWDGIITGSIFYKPEVSFLPQVIDDAAFGLSYNYYAGDVELLDFTATFIEFENGVLEPAAERESFSGEYTLVNIHEWEDPNTTLVVQTFEKVGNTWTNFSDISIPDEGSRVGFQNLSSLPLKIKGIKSGKKVSHKQ